MGSVDMDTWRELFDSIAVHPSLRTLNILARNGGDRLDRTLAVADMVSRNQMIEVIDSNAHSLDHSEEGYGRLIAPHLECNILRKRLVAIHHDIQDDAIRAGVLEKAFHHIDTTSPSLLYMSLTTNSDVISNYLH